MKARLDHWIEGLKYDWNISRQRFYGVPFPLWHCTACAEVVLAAEANLPVDPLEDPCPAQACPRCGGPDFRGEPDVMDTWMTSSLTPLINANWAGSPDRIGDMELHPMQVRVQAFEIIRTWLFYTLTKSHLHFNELPWRSVMISGWGLNENGKKISKRDLEKYTDASGYNRYEPHSVVRSQGADALRYWAAGSHLGHDLRYTERDVAAGRKLVVKLWNAARFALMQLGAFDPAAPRPAFAERTPEDRWLLLELNRILPEVAEGFEAYNYAVAREATDRFFWMTYCDDYLEMIKDRFWTPERYPESARASARATLWEALRTLLALYSPFLPFVTEELYQRIYRKHEQEPSIHVTRWPRADAEIAGEVPQMRAVLGILKAVRALRSEARISQTKELEALVIDLEGEEQRAIVLSMESSIQAVARARQVRYAPATHATEIEGIRVEIIPMAPARVDGGTPTT
jgi:valyl-tRNA synthetase